MAHPAISAFCTAVSLMLIPGGAHAADIDSVAALPYATSLASSASVPHASGARTSDEQFAAQVMIKPIVGRTVITFHRSSPPKWQQVASRHERQVLASSSKWERLISKFQHVHADDLLQWVNQEVNRAKYVSDTTNWQTPDHWATPQELLERGGDCEDFAIAKYLILREVGISASRMQIAISNDHAVLIVETQEGPVVLDSARADIRPLDAEFTKKVIFTINELHWAVHVGRGGYRLASR